MKLKSMVFAWLFVIAYCPAGGAFLWWGEKGSRGVDATIESLQKQQADDPSDPYTNYNLGVALYKGGKFAEAEVNFERASATAVSQDLKKRCFFNAGNSLYRGVVAALPENWESCALEQAKLDAVRAKTEQAIKKYDDVLALDKKHEGSTVNKKEAQKLLEKLKKKKQEPTDQHKDKQEQKQKEQKKDEQQQQKEQQGRQGQKKQEEKRDDSSEQGEHKNAPQEGEGQSKAGKPESVEQRGVRALLDDLQQEESKTQKALILKKIKDEGKPKDASQRPW